MTLRAAHWVAAVLVLQVLFAIVVSILSTTILTGSDCACFLNLSGGTCEFLAITSYFSLLFSLLAGLGAAPTLRGGPGVYLPSIVGSLEAFGSLWWLAAAVTASERGQQAGASGMPHGSARSGVIVLSWVEFARYVVAVAVVVYDLTMCKWSCGPTDRNSNMLLDVESKTDSQQEFKQAVYGVPYTA